jgi:membrane fusion protein (multidrug efflux system)
MSISGLESTRRSASGIFRPSRARTRLSVLDSLVSGLVLGLALGVGCKGGEDNASAGRGRPATPVVISSPFEHDFADRVEALGTARAYESVVITARASETIAAVHFEDGQIVESGSILVELERAEEVAQLAGARANRADAKLRFDRVADLAKRGTESQSRYDEVRSALDAANARVAELEARLSDLRIRAPFAGVLGLREVSPGTLVQPGDRITTLDDIDRIKLDFSVPEAYFSMLRPGLEVRTMSAAYPDRVFQGDVRAIDSRVDPDTRAIRVRAEVPNEDHALRPGMLLTLVLRANPTRSLAVAEEALVPRGSSQFIVVLDDEDRAQQVEVKIGRRVPGIVEVLSGVELGARVIIDGASLVRPGSVVRVLREESPPSA